MKMMTFLACMIYPSLLLADHDSSVSEKGCWDGLDEYENNCVVQGEASLTDGHVSVEWINNCSNRVYVRMCNERTNGSWDCGSDGARGGETVSWDSYDATGNIKAQAVGSDEMDEDWVCAGEVSNWNDD